VFHVFNHSGATDTAYPSDQAWADVVFPTCDGPFAAYTGQGVTVDGELTYSMYTPTADGWDDGDREVICFLFRADGATMASSSRVAKP
jgi:hypothetical protein